MTTSVTDRDKPAEDQPVSIRKAVAAGAIGQGLENYDFAVYGFLAAVLAALFFPQESPTAALLSTYIALAAGFVARPFGGYVLGLIGDKGGRRNALVIIVVGMSLATFAIGLLPTYAQIGVLAPILLFVLRLAQGFTAGADHGNASAFIVEYSPDSKRGFYGSWQQFAVIAGVLFASGLTVLLTTVVSAETLNAWAWRLPFLFALVPGLFGLYMRLRIPETPVFQELKESGDVASTPFRDAIANHLRPALIVLCVWLFWSVLAQAVFVYSIGHVTGIVGLALNQALLANTIGLGVICLTVPFMGLCRIGSAGNL